MQTKSPASFSMVSVGLVALLTAVGCGAEGEELLTETQQVTNYNGLSENGLGDNGLNANGLNVNGLNANGLNANGLNANGLFKTWFASASYRTQSTVMGYLVECALDGGQSTSYSGHTWPGRLGIAPGWYSGAPTQNEQRQVTACMMAHVNADGRHIMVSFRGYALNTTTTERSAYPKEEGTYFGNLMAGSAKKYACRGAYASYSATTYGRRCANNPSLCGFTDLGSCSAVCGTHRADGAWSDCRGADGNNYAATVTAFVK
jgi:hypothetical protein